MYTPTSGVRMNAFDNIVRHYYLMLGALAHSNVR